MGESKNVIIETNFLKQAQEECFNSLKHLGRLNAILGLASCMVISWFKNKYIPNCISACHSWTPTMGKRLENYLTAQSCAGTERPSLPHIHHGVVFVCMCGNTAHNCSPPLWRQNLTSWHRSPLMVGRGGKMWRKAKKEMVLRTMYPARTTEGRLRVLDTLPSRVLRAELHLNSNTTIQHEQDCMLRILYLLLLLVETLPIFFNMTVLQNDATRA